MFIFEAAIISLFFLLELFALASWSLWGFRASTSLPVKVILGIGSPLLVAFIWGTFISPKATVPVPLFLRIILQLSVFLSAAIALHLSGHRKLAMIFIAVAIIETAILHLLKL
ncbi:YrdB family protein [Metabacillus herbersteinensis]|uniref:YrdB family protein n=1 Tax=Metabacillus herbersteinensis TaxID=283816 RepID=A0ABV6GG15_9BACI